MKRFFVIAAVVVLLSAVFAGAGNAVPANHFNFVLSGGMTNPCTGAATTYSTAGHGLMVFSKGAWMVKMHASGTASDSLGETYAVTWDLTSINSPMASGSANQHVVIVFNGRQNTFVFHGGVHVNVRPDEPVTVDLEFVTCAGVGRASG